MATQTGSISFETQAGLNSYAKGQYATLAQVKGQFATSSTAAATAAKVATIVPADSGWELYAGATITVKFTTANDTAAPTLNVNSSGAKAIRDHAGAALTEEAYKWKAGDALAFTYDGTYWRLQDTLPQRVSTAETAIEQNAEAIKLTATKEEVEKTYVTKDDSQLDRADSGTSVAIDGAATALLKGLHVLGESVQDGTPTPSAPVPILSVGAANYLSNSDVSISATSGTIYVTNRHLLTRTIPKGSIVTVSCHIEAVNAVWPSSGNGRAGIEINQPSDGVVSGTQYVGVWWGPGGSEHDGDNTNYSGTISNTVVLTRDFVATGSKYMGLYIQTLTSGSITVSEPCLKVHDSPLYVASNNIGILVRDRNLFGKVVINNVLNPTTGAISASNANNWYGNKIPVRSDTMTLVIEDKGGYDGSFTLAFYGGNDEYLGVTEVTQFSGVTAPYTRSLTTKSGASYARAYGYYSGGAILLRSAKVAIYDGDSSYSYEPYSESITQVSLNGHELRSLPDGTQDELTIDTDGHVTMTQRVGAYRMADYASYAWYKSGSATNGYYIYYYQLPESVRFAPYASGDGNVYSNMASPASTASEYFAGPNKLWHDSAINFNLDGSVVGTTVAAFKTWLASSDLMAYAPLLTPQTIDLGTIDMPQVHDGDTVEVIAALTPSIDVTWWASAGQAVADAYASLSSAIEVKAESIVSTVSERYATSQEVQAISSQITQTAQGWTAQFNELTGGADLSMTLAQAFDALGVTSRNLEEIRSFVRITTDNAGDPLLLMGSATSPIMLALSNDSLRFMHGSDPVAYIDVDGTTNEGRLHITRAVVVKELQFGSWKWFERDGVGNLALKWVGDE